MNIDVDTCKVVGAYVIAESGRGGRTAFDRDRVTAAIVNGTLQVGDDVPVAVGGPKWRSVSPALDGVYSERELRGGYVALKVEVSTSATIIVRASGHGIFYGPGIVHAGDPYGTDLFHYPVKLSVGTALFVFSVGRGRLAVRFEASPNSAFLSSKDMTCGDYVKGLDHAVFAGIQTINPGEKAYLAVAATVGNIRTVSRVVMLPALSATKIPIQLPRLSHSKTTSIPIKFELLDVSDRDISHPARVAQSKVVNTIVVDARVRTVLETRKDSFLSDMDGSAQYYGVRPAQRRGPNQNLVITLHGASVEGMGQAEAYGNYADINWIAATNRRPYGFDWEDWGRKDVLEVLADSQAKVNCSPSRVHLAGHSMGGHGTWVNGSLYPSTFASIAPSAGWVSFASYGGGGRPTATPDAVDRVFDRANNEYDTLLRVPNLEYQSVFVLHGDADDNVPVAEARTMKGALEKLKHPRFGYHEQPGAGHWWDGPQGPGADCLDWPGITDAIKSSQVTDPNRVRFVTPHPGISSSAFWIAIDQQLTWGDMSSVDAIWNEGGKLIVTCQNVATFTISERNGIPRNKVVRINAQDVEIPSTGNYTFTVKNNIWKRIQPLDGRVKTAERSGPFKNAFGNKVAFILPSGGTQEENDLALQVARYHMETWMVRGNGFVDIVLDTDDISEHRTYVLYGNRTINRAWSKLINRGHLDVTKGAVTMGDHSVKGANIICLATQPHPIDSKSHVIVFGYTGDIGARVAMRVPFFVSGVAIPDWVIAKSDVFTGGRSGVVGAGYFGSNWSYDVRQSAWH